MKEHGYNIREAFENDFPSIAHLFRSHDYGLKKLDWLKWKYGNHPDGKCRMYVAVDPLGHIIAFQGYIPRRITSARTGTFSVMHSVDVFVAAEQRKLGVYSKMCRHTMSTLLAPKISFPNERSLNFSIRDGFRAVGPFKEWIFPVVIGRLLEKKPWRFLAPLADLFSKAYAFVWLGNTPSGLQMRSAERFTKDFELKIDQLHGLRSADYLNWRFMDNPKREYSAYEFCDGEQILGYGVYAGVGSTARVFDLCVERRHRECLRLLVDHCRERRMTHVSFPAIGMRFGKFGFLHRRLPDRFAVLNVPEGPWMVTLCDKDV